MQASQGWEWGGYRCGRNHYGKESADEGFRVCFLHQWLFYIISFITTELQNIELEE